MVISLTSNNPQIVASSTRWTYLRRINPLQYICRLLLHSANGVYLRPLKHVLPCYYQDMATSPIRTQYPNRSCSNEVPGKWSLPESHFYSISAAQSTETTEKRPRPNSKSIHVRLITEPANYSKSRSFLQPSPKTTMRCYAIGRWPPRASAAGCTKTKVW